MERVAATRAVASTFRACGARNFAIKTTVEAIKRMTPATPAMIEKKETIKVRTESTANATGMKPADENS